MSIPPSVHLPAGVEPITVPVGRGSLAGLAAGPGTAPDLVMVPGFTGSKEDFLPLLPLLAATGRTVWAVDQWGQFESTAPDDPAAHSMAGWATDLLDIAAAAPEPPHLLGHSFGGLVCRAAVLREPEAFASLILLNTGPGRLPESHEQRLSLLCSVIPPATMSQIWDAKEELDRQDGIEPPPPDVHRFLRTRWVASSPGALRVMAEQLMAEPDRTDELRAITDRLAVLVAYGVDDDSAWPVPELARMAQRLGCRAAAIPAAAHSPAVENPSATAAALVAFLARGRPSV